MYYIACTSNALYCICQLKIKSKQIKKSSSPSSPRIKKTCQYLKPEDTQSKLDVHEKIVSHQGSYINVLYTS